MKSTKLREWKPDGILVLMLLATAASGQITQKLEPPRREILVSIADRKLAVLEDGNILKIFPVAVGASVTPSPAGAFQIVNRLVNPGYFHPGIVIPPGKTNPLGPRWIGLNKKSYGIHGTNEPSSIGKAASHGCIRLRNRDIQELFAMVRVGDEVGILSERDPLTTEIFAGPEAIPEHEDAVSGASAAGGAQ
jgi:lipoprotein-anchoring transpeptidase ErfK/SrfK